MSRLWEWLKNDPGTGWCNRRQLLVLWAGIAVFLLMGLFPPWYHTREATTQ